MADLSKSSCPMCHTNGVEGLGCPSCPGFWFTARVQDHRLVMTTLLRENPDNVLAIRREYAYADLSREQKIRTVGELLSMVRSARKAGAVDIAISVGSLKRVLELVEELLEAENV